MEHRILSDVTVTKSVLAIFVPPGAGERNHPNRPSHGLAFIESGSSVYLFKGNKRIVQQPGEILYFPKGSSYVVEKFSEGGTYAVNFDIDEPISAEPFLCRFRDPREIKRLFAAAVRQYEGRADSDYFIRGTVYQLLYAIRTEQRESMSKSASGILFPAMEYLRDHGAQEVYIPDLARMCGISETYFRRVFRKTYGVAPVVYLNRLRYERALRLLRSGEYTVHTVADLTGFPDDSSFSRFFKKMSGSAPSLVLSSSDEIHP